MPATRESSPVYDVHPGVIVMQKWIAELPAKTGRSLEQWIRHVRAKGPAQEAARRDWLKRECGLGTNAAGWIAERSAARSGQIFEDDPKEYLKLADGYVETMYAGGKSGLRPIHEALVKPGCSIAKDVKVCPCQTIVPLFRNHVFAQIKPATRSRIDFGLALKGAKGRLPAKLIDTGGLARKDRITHCFSIAELADIDDEVRKWTRIAYDLDV